MTIAIRVDANSTIGMGHLMRCMSIATQIKNCGHSVLFICSDSNCYEKIGQSDFKVIIMHTKYDNLESEIKQMRNIIKLHNIDKLLIDTYFVTYRYLIEIREIVRIYYIDDINAFKYPVDYLINYNISYDKFDYENVYKNTNTDLILSTKYVPLRQEFQKLQLPEINSTIKNVFISTGGSDSFNVSVLLAKAVSKSPNFEDITFHFVIGKFSKSIHELTKIQADNANIVLHYDVTNISSIMLMCDVAVSAAGSTLYELCACGVPTIMFSIADNQESIAQSFSEKDIMLYIGRWNENRIEQIINSIILKYDIRKKYRLNMVKVTDGLGAKRLAHIICNI